MSEQVGVYYEAPSIDELDARLAAKQARHSGASVDLKPDGFVGIELTRASVLSGPGAQAFVLLPTLESAEVLRDALSAFITFHRRMSEAKSA